MPSHRVPRVSIAELDALARGAEASGEWLGAPVRLALDGDPVRPPPAADTTLAVLLEDAAGARAALLIDPPIALLMVERVVGGDGDELVMAPLTDMDRGVLAHTIARWLREGESRFGVAAVLTSGVAVREALGAHDCLRWPLALHVGAARGNAALVMAEDALAEDALAEDALAEDAPTALPAWALGMRVEVAVTAGTAALAAHTVAALEPGDVVVPDDCYLRVTDGALSGRVRLESGRAAWVCELTGDSLELIHHDPNTPSSAAGMNEREAGDTPVTLVVELARLTVPIEQLAPGELLRAGTIPWVALRAGDQRIAEGELVEVEGELGVRIARRASPGPTNRAG